MGGFDSLGGGTTGATGADTGFSTGFEGASSGFSGAGTRGVGFSEELFSEEDFTLFGIFLIMMVLALLGNLDTKPDEYIAPCGARRGRRRGSYNVQHANIKASHGLREG